MGICEPAFVQKEDAPNRILQSSLVSCNLATSSCDEVDDGSKCFAIYTCSRGLKSVTNWYQLFPNLIGVRRDGKPFQGLACKLSHGVGIAFDRRVVRSALTLPHGVELPKGWEVMVQWYM